MFFTGIDIVHIPSFAAQLETPGSTFESVFSAHELRHAARYTGARRQEHLAGRWAAKEAFIKAWSQSLYGRPPVIAADRVDFSEIAVVADQWGRVAFRLAGEVAQLVDPKHVSLSISHDQDYAVAHVVGEF
ncbi:4'-phosphopantetheinyl transferase [Corynebacterium renale]|uniref:holo-ACP synthase AcpS n=1 Tax=Corynebacterium renale TaxID=1724 RepID=UPI000DA370C1|nr:holo-ACP synthase [Corynebacterium renale]SQG65288.1 4'-phosphopantetheinyl transferase [Corynebacterium renale]STC98592.1 4'-phosphopantetheinyl transferase [Corynebacterium renale]